MVKKILFVTLGLLCVSLGNGLKCYTCTSQKDENCIKIDVSTSSQQCTGNHTICTVKFDSNGFTIRGCEALADTAGSGSEHQCSKDFCNTQPLILECISCYGENCRSTFGLGDVKVCPVSRQAQCYLFKESSIARGCYHDGIVCNPNECLKCSGKQCNADKFYSCYSCNGEQNSNCRTNPSEVVLSKSSTCFTCESKENRKFYRGTSSLETLGSICDSCSVDSDGHNCNSRKYVCYTCEDCEVVHSETAVEICNLNEKCITALTDDGKTIRGCSKKLPDCEKDNENCIACIGDKCNEGSVPAKQLHCFQCKGTEGCLLSQNPSNAEICNAEMGENCYMYVNDQGQIFRGCGNDPDFKSCEDYKESCKLFSESYGNHEAMHKNFSCARCSQEGSCSWLQSSNSQQIEDCNYFYYQDAQCFTKIVQTVLGPVVTRGCANSDEYSCLHGSNPDCQYCQDTQCNLAAKEFNACIVCNSDEHPDCVGPYFSPKHYQLCQPAVYERRGCYTRRKGDFVERGCLSNFQLNNTCLDDNSEECARCDSGLCNIESVPQNTPKSPLKCYSCSNSDACDDIQDPKELKVFDKAGATDLCYIYFNKLSNHLVRGWTGDENFQNCDDSLGCSTYIAEGNSEAMYVNLFCAQCQNDNECAVLQDDKSNVKCNLLYFESATENYNGCYTAVGENGLVARGCSLELGVTGIRECALNLNNCQFCLESRCNVEAADTIFPKTISVQGSSTTESDYLPIPSSTSDKSDSLPSGGKPAGVNQNEGLYTMIIGSMSLGLLMTM